MNRPDFTVADLGELASLHTAEIKEGANVWVAAEGDYWSKAVTGADVTLTFTEAQATGITTTGVLGAAHNLIVPTIAGMTWDVFCNNTGAFATTFKTATGSGIVVAQGKRARLMCDGTDVVRVTADV
jgi:hypothetical protein